MPGFFWVKSKMIYALSNGTPQTLKVASSISISAIFTTTFYITKLQNCRNKTVE
eukprot:UN02606